MHAMVHGERTLTDIDYARLNKLLSQQRPAHLADWFESAEVTGSRAAPDDLVTMNSRVEVVDVHTHHRQVLTICYPGDAEPTAEHISVLSPVGSSLLGLRAGDTARWLTPHGEGCAAQIVAIQYQPEATGDYTR
ncbi:MAG: GreA/GreB family elongation factor [Polaromonas sp.]|uniref:GreA/GreB family elongation factor n=1 Tax=Polaromonas sp. TaxID=1869339 RepID=UPI0025EBB17E|nr:GreA/GreB family elongation factor [Polaromonas sp.]MBI2726714.1 GreA/GreB family elongation factor [Polaromonas sp.]